MRASLDLGVPEGQKVEVDDLLEERRHEPSDDGTVDVELNAYGYLWLRLRREGERALS